MRQFRRLIAVLIAAALAPVSLLAQEAATVTGRVTNAQGGPEAAVLVRIESLNAGASTGADGTYRLVIPGGRIRAGQSVQITASRQGLSQVSRSVTLSPGATLTQNFTMAAQIILLEDVVVTGTAGAVEERKVPFEVAQVSGEDIVVPPSNAASALQGKVAGVTVVQGSGRPGSAPSVLLRGPKSINASGRDQEPLYIVDGVILNASISDIDALDIEEIEVLKGAAAASLYGSRAANGVIQIRTRRGSAISDDRVRYVARTEFGRSNIPGTPDALLTESHHYKLVDTDSGQFFVNSGGQLCAFQDCVGLTIAGSDAFHTYQNQAYPGQTYDQLDRFFREGDFSQHYVAAEGRAGLTNFHVSYSNLNDAGILPGLEGQNRHNFRVNVDQAIRSNIAVQASAFYSRSESDQFPEGNGNPIFDLTRMPAGVNLFACEDDPATDADERQNECLDDPNNLVLQPHPTNTESSNPIYDLLNRDYRTRRGRFMGSANLRVSPVNFFDVDANVSYDRLDRSDEDYYHKGYRTITPSPTFNEGYLDRYQLLTEALNASVTGTFRFDLTDNIANRTQFRYLYEQADAEDVFTAGYDFAVGGLRNFDIADPDNFSAQSSLEPVRSEGYFAITNFDIADRYIIDALVRNDGSSLFGPEQRRQWYYRLAGAWLISEEPWFNLPVMDELKLRYSRGTAGGRPAFAAQYETFDVSGGSVVPITLGNVDLKPEFTTEDEVGIEFGFLEGRVQLDVNYARSVTEDQILPLPLPAFTGYRTRTTNAGTLESNTWEVALDTRLLERGNFAWNARLNYDRTRSKITELAGSGFRYGVPGQALATAFFARQGEELGTFYGVQFAESCEHLPASIAGECDQFAVNDDGLLVWVGEGGSLEDRNWGTLAPANIRLAGTFMSALRWGQPFGGLCVDRVTGNQTDYCPLGRTLPDYSVGLSSTISWGGLSVYGLLNAVQGISVYNQPLQWAVFQNQAGLSDQAGIPEELQKPISYYGDLYGASGLGASSAFVEDGSFVKLRELSFRYSLGDRILGRFPGISGVDGLTLMLTGRNLKTWTDYRGFDPEVGATGGETGSAALGRVEGYQYPNFRTWTLGVEVNF
ncbi:MAG TPA: SusC/RagA family TonB-linked outer membrane protein [Longimicrobium sp.]|jgi:TonB-linked SusC/RagA family outer membrane protein|uniref:SusC/RagA family TonB-linked outer membrane protein n=1 Tax=Longimicrobium sp. TaxID=2029185 RepID=UPI002ED937F3